MKYILEELILQKKAWLFLHKKMNLVKKFLAPKSLLRHNFTLFTTAFGLIRRIALPAFATEVTTRTAIRIAEASIPSTILKFQLRNKICYN